MRHGPFSSSSTSTGRLESAKKLAIVGTIPPPYGGVSVHVMRAFELLRKHPEFAPTLYEPTGKSDPDRAIQGISRSAMGLARVLLRFRQDVIHFHFNGASALELAGVLMRLRAGKRYLLTIHSERPMRVYRAAKPLRRRLLRACFQRASMVICVNATIAGFMRDEVGLAAHQVQVLPAFLPPSAAELDAQNIPRDLAAFCGRHDVVVGSHGCFGYFLDDRHVYGFDWLARLAKEISDSGKSIGLYTLASGSYDDSHRGEIMEQAKELRAHWLIEETPFPAVSVFPDTHLFLRPTVTDGDSVSIRECLSLGIPVLASDCVARPGDCTLHDWKDYGALSKVFWRTVDRLSVQAPPNIGADQCERELVRLVGDCFPSGVRS